MHQAPGYVMNFEMYVTLRAHSTTLFMLSWPIRTGTRILEQIGSSQIDTSQFPILARFCRLALVGASGAGRAQQQASST